MRKISAPGPQNSAPGSGGGIKSSLKKQSSFDLSSRKISSAEAPPRRPIRVSVIQNYPSGESLRRISTTSTCSSSKGPHSLSNRYSSAFDASEFRRTYLESHFNENEITVQNAPRSSASKKPPLFGPSLEASSKFRKKLRTKAEAEQGKLLEKLHKLNNETHELQARTEECLFGSQEDFPEDPESNKSSSLIRNFCLTTFKILTVVNECYELVKSIQNSRGGVGSAASGGGLSASVGNLLSESFRNHDFGKDISVSYFGLDWNELRSLIRSLEAQVSTLGSSSRKNSVETNYGHYYGHQYAVALEGSSEHSGSERDLPSLESLCVSICKDLRKLRDDVLSHTEAVLRGRLSPANKQIISEEQNRFRAYSVINSLLSHSHQPLERKGSFTNKLLSLFHPLKKKQAPPSSSDNVWTEWFEVAINQTQLLKKIQEI